MLSPGIKKKFKDLKRGDYFSLSTRAEDREYLNIKVEPATIGGDNMPFNCIAFRDGRPRTFHDDADIYQYDKKEVLG